MALFPLLWREQVRLCKKAICFLLHSPLKEMMPIVTKNTEHVENEELIIHTIKKYLSDEKAVNAAMRWYMRGLPLKYCIRKVLVDQEVAQSCNQKRK